MKSQLNTLTITFDLSQTKNPRKFFDYEANKKLTNDEIICLKEFLNQLHFHHDGRKKEAQEGHIEFDTIEELEKHLRENFYSELLLINPAIGESYVQRALDAHKHFG